MPVCSNCGELFPDGKLVCPECGMDADAGWAPEPDEDEFEETEERKKPAGCAGIVLLVLVCATLLVLL